MSFFVEQSTLLKKASLILGLGVSVAIWGQNAIKFEDSDFQSILAKAKKEKKLIFMDAYASWCGPCKLMEKNVFTDAKVADYYNKNFINAHFDMEKGEGVTLAQKYFIRSYPTLLFINGDGEAVGQELGYIETSEFIKLGEKYNKPSNTQGSLQERFDKGERDPDFLISYFKMAIQNNPIKAKQAAEAYFKAKKDLEFSSDEINMLFGSIQSNQDANYQYIVAHKDLLSRYIGNENYEQFLMRINIPKIIQDATNVDKKTFDDQYFIKEASKFLPADQVQNSLSIVKLSFYQTVENWTEYEKSALNVFKTGDGISAGDLVQAATLFNDHVTNKASLVKASMWAEKALMSEDSYRTNAILAQLYNKIGKKSEAKSFAESAVAHSRGQNVDLTEINKIINQK
ncbi:thioredoxin fold domain-containing protein [Soonwooa sp.]|uniref:thioredoxin family protein n=1 Tax=Soonwooa sp. TaxID=1938592 RepID=UPI00260352CD|nr:thioredoxin fold domain-containing protein [Soonwooa sp.]